MNVMKGDLIEFALQGNVDVIVHGCNCFCVMGAGVARQIRDAFPEAYAAGQATEEGDRNKLGTISCAQVKRNAHLFTVVNAYTQYHYSGVGPLVDYAALRNVFKEIKRLFSGNHIAYPKIGAGLAGGDWGRISAIIDDVMSGENHTLVLREKN